MDASRTFDPPNEARSRSRTSSISRREITALLVILAAAGTLRFIYIADTGILNVDEGRYLLDARGKLAELQFGLDTIRAKWVESRGGPPFLLSEAVPRAQSELSENAPFLPKILFSYACAAIITIWGFVPWAGGAVEATFGVMMVGMLWLLVRTVASPRAALIAAALLAISCYHVYYSRNAYPQCISAFFFMAAVYLQCVWQRRSCPLHGFWLLFAAGASSGCAFLANFQVAGALPALIILHVAMCATMRPARQAIWLTSSGVAVFAAGFLAPVVVAEAATYPYILTFRSQGIPYPHKTFLELLAPRLTHHAAVRPHAGGILLFPYFFTVFEGIPAVASIGGVLALAGLLRAREHRKPVWSGGGTLWVAMVATVPWLIYSVKTLQGARTFVYVLPFVWALLAILVDWIFRQHGRKVRLVMGALLVVAMTSSLWHTWEVIHIRSGYPDVMRFAIQNGRRPVVAAWSSVPLCYTQAYGLQGGSVYAPPDETTRAFFVSDWQELYNGRYGDESPIVRRDAKPVGVFQHNFGRIFLLAETFPSYADPIAAMRWQQLLDLEHARNIYVYDRGDVDTRLEDHSRPPLDFWELSRDHAAGGSG